MKQLKKEFAVEVKDFMDYTDVYFNGARFGSVEKHWDNDESRYQWFVFSNTFDSNRKVLDKAQGVAYLEALIAMGTN